MSICSNSPGSFECACNQGYRLQFDGRSCVGAYLQRLADCDNV